MSSLLISIDPTYRSQHLRLVQTKHNHIYGQPRQRQGPCRSSVPPGGDKNSLTNLPLSWEHTSSLPGQSHTSSKDSKPLMEQSTPARIYCVQLRGWLQDNG